MQISVPDKPNSLQSNKSYVYEPLIDIRLEEDVFYDYPPLQSEELEEEPIITEFEEETHNQPHQCAANDEFQRSQEGLRRKLKTKWNHAANKLHTRYDVEQNTGPGVDRQHLAEEHATPPIERDWDQIRLIELLPGGFKDSIMCRMHHLYIQDVGTSMWWSDVEYLEGKRPEYEALSYSWGESLSNDSIYINDRSFLVRSNLVTILRYLTKKNVSRMLWVDAICINQNDVAEKNVQVQRMVQIYRQASAMLVWLGEPTETSDMAFKTIENERNLKSWKNVTEARKRSLLCLSTEHSWWSRMWII
ncbi:heterokaryon incompatibility protein [Glarea lozoyensis ATCC 20868]|uniref:Heterokaryon incompatibility protein n=1 Tax=Glarea lozoyensis (strain ATCC 20868 / MF5171) TaxID=1116229 RepID=S3DQN0_GLAL2|nr:heterokaryon incompatibility protein [Glarea lozoyensis ATCC 20868]EPE34326.1 heterokaryon incompatibility protein [Glarea lozoyensis ATCC 20868]